MLSGLDSRMVCSSQLACTQSSGCSFLARWRRSAGAPAAGCSQARHHGCHTMAPGSLAVGGKSGMVEGGLQVRAVSGRATACGLGRLALSLSTHDTQGYDPLSCLRALPSPAEDGKFSFWRRLLVQLRKKLTAPSLDGDASAPWQLNMSWPCLACPVEPCKPAMSTHHWPLARGNHACSEPCMQAPSKYCLSIPPKLSLLSQQVSRPPWHVSLAASCSLVGSRLERGSAKAAVQATLSCQHLHAAAPRQPGSLSTPPVEP